MSKSAIKRIINKDFKEIKNLDLNSLGIYINFNENNILEAYAMIVGPKDTLYEGGFLFFNIKFPNNYPFSPPELKYIPNNKVRIHPNIYANGKVCLSILGTWSGPKWTSIMDITTVLLTIQSLLDNQPFHHEPGQDKSPEEIKMAYNQIIKYNTFSSLILGNYKNIPKDYLIFKNDMDEIIQSNKDIIVKKLNNNKNNDKKTISFSFYRMSVSIDYEKLFIDYKNTFIN